MGPSFLASSKYRISKTILGKVAFMFGALAILLDYEDVLISQ